MSAEDIGDAETVRRVFERMPIAMLAMEGPEHRIIAVNALARELSGRAHQVGGTVAEVFPAALTQQVLAILDRAYRTGVTQKALEWRLQLEHDDGSRPESYFDIVVTPHRDDSGAVVGLSQYSVEVSDRVREREAERQRAERAERRYARARDVVVAMQLELLPGGLPVLPRARAAAGYLPADADTAAGGDWFDALALSDGRLALVLGDVAGHGVAASATMGQLRAVVQDRLLDDGDITVALAAANRLAGRLPAARGATICVAVLDPADGTLEYCTAGHPPPLLVGAGGPSRYLPATGAPPLGGGDHFPLGADRLAVGDLLLLVSDGLIERPGREYAESLVELANVAEDTAGDRVLRDSGLTVAQRVCVQTIELLLRPTGHTDDVTMLAVQRVPPPSPLGLSLTASTAAIGRAHVAVGEWLRALGASDKDIAGIRHAVSELVTNCVQHAYRGGPPGRVRLSAELDTGGEVRVEVADDGSWHEHPPAVTGGLGLVLVEQMVHQFRLRRGHRGTTAEIRHRITTPARLLIAERIGPSPAGEPDLLLVLDQPAAPAPRVRLDGPITLATAGFLATELQRFTLNGTRSLTVDLTGVTLLASAGVVVFQHAVRRAADQDGDLVLYAPAGSPAQHVLTLSALPHTTTDPHTGA
ncbi:SpoIIE family protein phosphatase [Actinoplanes sp. NPDC048988]|uniref:SpoIIE family protein phosphatase n=1 Tax=Actinoplanes sp. NPDC048988 TaxID=3363901 RepID=UPI00371DEAF0